MKATSVLRQEADSPLLLFEFVAHIALFISHARNTACRAQVLLSYHPSPDLTWL